jgi:hypothetical protein
MIYEPDLVDVTKDHVNYFRLDQIQFKKTCSLYLLLLNDRRTSEDFLIVDPVKKEILVIHC